MSIDEAQVQKIAKLARLSIHPSDVEEYTQNLQKILSFVEEMNNYDLSAVQELHNQPAAQQRLRKDTVTENNQRDKLLAVAPNVEAGLYLVPKVIDNE